MWRKTTGLVSVTGPALCTRRRSELAANLPCSGWSKSVDPEQPIKGPVSIIPLMPVLTAGDGTRLSYQASGDGVPVVCLPGGPLLDSASLGDLGGLSGRLRLIRPDYRGTGRSETPIS